MARIAGIDLPKDKRVEIGLTYIYGIGRTSYVAREQLENAMILDGDQIIYKKTGFSRVL